MILLYPSPSYWTLELSLNIDFFPPCIPRPSSAERCGSFKGMESRSVNE